MADNAYPDALPPQYRLHWYTLERVLGQGGFGITYLARDTNLDQAVAIKEYLPVEVATRRADSTVQPRSEDQSERYRWGLERFILEARTLAKFDHPNIVRVLSVFEQNGTAYMVMRFEEGENFGALLDRRRTLGEDDLMRVLLPVLDGLKLVHDAGFIHRDIKPDNIHIRADGSPVLLDFGSARHSMGQARTVTILVAPGYAPFEQYYSSGEDQGPWTDIYSLGATCYRAITGVAPMDAIARSKGILGSTRELLVPATAIGAGRYSERLLKAVDHALAFAEKDRPGTIAQWRRELTGERPAAAPPTRPATAAAPVPAPTPNPPRPPVARTAALVTAVGAFAILGGVLGAYLVNRKEPDQKSAKANVEAPKLAGETAKPEPTAVPTPPPAAPVPPPTPSQAVAPPETATPQPPVQPQPLQVAVPTPPKGTTKTAPPKTAKPSPERPPQLVARADPTPEPPPPVSRVPECPQVGDLAIFNCYRGLALGGDASAALKLGELFEAGRGVEQSNLWAYSWYEIAARRGADGARARKESIAKRLQAMEIQQGDNYARSQQKSGK